MRNKQKLCLLCSTVGLVWGAPAWGQSEDSASAESSGNDIIVTAQRMEERLQDVPISITVLNQKQLTANNVTTAADLASYTPGLSTTNRYGSDNTTFAIRGFVQELRSLSTVGVYFADVVMPRGSASAPGGDGAGPGALFDLQNVQVLKGPQGTLFGRVSTGGAVLLVPQKPTDKLEGYVEGYLGDYDLRRVQAVLNVPLADTFKVRLGLDRQKRDGWLRNIGLGPKNLGDSDYWAARLSIVADLTPDLENYTIATYVNSKSNGVIPKIATNGIAPSSNYVPRNAAGGSGGCYPGVVQAGLAFGDGCVLQVARESQYDFWTVSNRLPNPKSDLKQWQVINTTTWHASDNLTVKNIVSYAELRGDTALELFGSYAPIPGADINNITSPAQLYGFAFTNPYTGGHTNSQSTFVEELQFQGNSTDGRLTWQAGLYIELSDPIGFSGVQTASFTPCLDISQFNCVAPTPGVSAGTGSFSISKTRFRDYAVYGQASYDITDQIKLTVGARYTWDKMTSEIHQQTFLFQGANPPLLRCTNNSAPGYEGTTVFPFTLETRFDNCKQILTVKTSAPTWTMALDYKPIEDLMLYAKWSRGYRQGATVPFGPDTLNTFKDEKVDTYEVGAKAAWRGAVPGTFAISGFYNDFRNQQLQFGVACVNLPPQFVIRPFTVACAGNASPLNAGKSNLYGMEADLTLRPFRGFQLNASYAYLHSELRSITIPEIPEPYNFLTPPALGTIVNTQPHKVTVMANYTLPLDEAIGDITFGGTYTYTAAYRAQTDQNPGSNNGVLPGTHVFNINVSWENIAGAPIDAGFFMTNVTNEKIFLHSNDNETRGFTSYFIGQPRMWGVRLKYRFGE